jgi:hypothetical protein
MTVVIRGKPKQHQAGLKMIEQPLDPPEPKEKGPGTFTSKVNINIQFSFAKFHISEHDYNRFIEYFDEMVRNKIDDIVPTLDRMDILITEYNGTEIEAVFEHWLEA